MLRFFSILAGLLVFLFLSLFLTRNWGLSQVEGRYDHPFFDNQASANPEIFEETFNLQNLKDKSYITVHQTEDGQMILMKPTEIVSFLKFKKEEQRGTPQQFVFKGNKINNYSLDEIQKTNPTFTKLDQLIQKICQNPKYRFILNVGDNATNIDLQLVSFLDQCPTIGDQMILSSRVGIVITSIKTLRPRWLYGSSQDDWTRFLTFDSLYLLPATPFKRDIYITPLKYRKRKMINQDIVDELRRRNKRIIIGPLENQQDLELAQTFKPDGLILTKFELHSQHE